MITNIKLGRRLSTIVVAAAATLALSAAVFATGAQAAWYSVVGTQGYGLNVRTAPSRSASLVANLRESTAINIVCQMRGDSVGGSTMWDRINAPAGGYVADYFTTTPVFNGPSPGLPSCQTPPPPPSSDVAGVAERYNGQAEIPSAFARQYGIGPHWSGFCESLVALVVYGKGRFGSALSDYYYHRNLGVIHGGVPPRNAIVYWNPPGSGGFGHIGISLGNGNEISTYGFYPQDLPIQEHSYAWFGNYLGWTLNY